MNKQTEQSTKANLSEQSYRKQLDDKINYIHQSFVDFTLPELAIFTSPHENYRMRTEFRVWHEGDDLYYVMFDQTTKQKYRLDQFPPASQLINQMMPILIEHIKVSATLRNKLFQVDFLSTISGEILVSLLYHRQLDDEWEAAARQLKEKVVALGFQFNLIGRAKKMKKVLDQDYVTETLTVEGLPYYYKQVENSFTQPNAFVAQHMLTWALKCSEPLSGDLVELYCGNGNFSIVLAQQFTSVLATEISKSSVDAAHYNLKLNQVDNVKIARLSAEEFTEAMTGKRVFRRLLDQQIDLSSYTFNTIFVDPPRAGLDQATCDLVQQFPYIIYISCNPETLRANLEQLCQTHEIVHFALFDQFPYTTHIESGVLLREKSLSH